MHKGSVMWTVFVIREKANNSTSIRFSQQTTQPQTLTAEENALFQLAK